MGRRSERGSEGKLRLDTDTPFQIATIARFTSNMDLLVTVEDLLERFRGPYTSANVQQCRKVDQFPALMIPLLPLSAPGVPAFDITLNRDVCTGVYVHVSTALACDIELMHDLSSIYAIEKSHLLLTRQFGRPSGCQPQR